MTTTSAQLPRSLVISIVVLCLLPTLLNLFKIDFGTPHIDVTVYQTSTDPLGLELNGKRTANSPETEPIIIDHRGALLSRKEAEGLFCHLVEGEFVNSFLEWTAFCIALCTVTFAFTHYIIKRDATTPIIGTALFFSGMIDAFRSLAAARLLGDINDVREFIPFTWALSRLFNVCILIIGTGILIWTGKRNQGWQRRTGLTFIIVVGLLIGILSYVIVWLCTLIPNLPPAIRENYLIRRPFDAIALVLYMLAGGIIFPRFQKVYPSLFAHALIISVIPNIAAQLHAAFGSRELYDNHYNISNYQKIIAYLVPLLGLLLEYTRAYQAEVSLRATEEQFRVARGVQRDLLPRSAPNIPGFDIAGVSIPAEMVGGDYFDFIPMKDDCLGIVVADVSGHDLGASIFMGQTRAYLRALAQSKHTVPEVMHDLNEFLMEDARDQRFVTIALARLDPANKILRLTAAGQHAYIVSHNKTFSPLESAAMPLGIVHDVRQEIETEWRLSPGDIFVSLTDGLSEALAPGGEFFGTQRILDIVAREADKPAEQIIQTLVDEVHRFVGTTSLADDLTIVILRTLPIG